MGGALKEYRLEIVWCVYGDEKSHLLMKLYTVNWNHSDIINFIKQNKTKQKKIMNPFSFKSSTFPLISYRPVYIGQTLHLLIVERRRENQMIICALGNYPFVR